MPKRSPSVTAVTQPGSCQWRVQVGIGTVRHLLEAVDREQPLPRLRHTYQAVLSA
jgi:hypothetical protein